MTVAWISTRMNPYLIRAFRSANRQIIVSAPFQFLESTWLQSSQMNVEIIVFEISDPPLLDLCRKICIQKLAPMLAVVSNLAYAQAALEAGADDFIMVPVDPIEALLRVRKLARNTKLVRVGDLEINLAAWSVSYRGKLLHLSPVEFRLLASLAKRVGQIVAHATILEDVWSLREEHKTLAQLQSNIARLRRKIEPNVQNPQYIILIRGAGYKLRNHRQWQANQSEFGSSHMRR